MSECQHNPELTRGWTQGWWRYIDPDYPEDGIEEWSEGEDYVALQCTKCGLEGPRVNPEVIYSEPEWTAGGMARVGSAKSLRPDAHKQAHILWRDLVDPDYHLPALICMCDECRALLRAIGNHDPRLQE